jgi:Na+-driven multidrug efflux pump
VYIRVAAGGIPFVLFIVAGTGHLRGLADARTPLVIILASNVVNVVAELVLVYAAGMGIVGSDDLGQDRSRRCEVVERGASSG